MTPQEALQAIIDGKKLECRWYLDTDDMWQEFDPLSNGVCIGSIFEKKFKFRLAQEMITIGDVSFPKPESEPLEYDTEYWATDPTNQHYTTHAPNHWHDDRIDRRYLRRGLVHLTRENAIAHAKALIKLSGGNVDE